MATERPYAPQLDGLRAIAVVAVAFSHWQSPQWLTLSLGDGVHLFYVLSGFLITGILCRVRDGTDRAHGLRAFYARRALRIFPAFYLTLALTSAAGVSIVRDTWPWHASYLSNVWVAVNGWPPYISHFWSLAVEEQFYLLWPWVVLFVPARWLLPVLAATIASAPAFHYWVDSLDPPRESMVALLPSSLDSLGVGALVAVIEWRRRGAIPARMREVWLWTSLLAWAGLHFWGAAGLPRPSPLPALEQTAEAFLFGWVVVSARDGFAGPAGRLLAWRPATALGRVSYGAYLWHAFAPWLVDRSWYVAPSTTGAIVARLSLLSGTTLVAAALSWRLVERPLNAWKTRVPYQAERRN